METRLNKKLETFLQQFKEDICVKINELDINNMNKSHDLMTYIYEYKPIYFVSTDINKRKREKNTIPKYNRCSAKRANNEQCTRRKKDDCEFCGTHAKGLPHGIINFQDEETEQKSKSHKKIEVFTVDIKGIIYYIDEYNNVYDTEDIVENIINPRIIAKCEKINDTGEYSITNFYN